MEVGHAVLAFFCALLKAFFSSLALRFSFFACSRRRFAWVCGPGLAMMAAPSCGRVAAHVTTKSPPVQTSPVCYSCQTVYTSAPFHIAFIEPADMVSTSS